MILIVGKYERLAGCLAEKFRERHYGGEVLVRNSTRLLDFLNAHASEIELLVYLDKRHRKDTDDPSRVEYTQLLWTAAAKLSLPVIFVFFKYYSDSSIDVQVERFIAWTEKQYRKPPVYYLFNMGELYGLGDGESIVEWYCHKISQTGVANIVRSIRGDETEERQLDYMYVKDVLRVLYWFAVHHPKNGVYELGSGFSRTDTALVGAVFRAFGLPLRVKYEDNVETINLSKFPIEEVDLTRLRRIGYRKPFYSVEKGVNSYVKNILRQKGAF